MIKFLFNFQFIFICLFLIACQSQPTRAPSQTKDPQIEVLPDALDAARIVFKNATAKQKQDLNKIGESSLIQFFIENPGAINDIDKKNFVTLNFKKMNSKNNHEQSIYELPSMNKEGGYDQLELYVSHPYYSKNRLIKASNLRQTWLDFILSAKKQIILNVYEFDLEVIALALAKKADEGLEVTVGVDAKSLLGDAKTPASEGSKKVYQILSRSKVKLVPVETSALNHQKVVAIDWENTEDARVLFSSGNLTQSCLGPEGDLIDIPERQRPEGSIPNANHVITMKSATLANLVHHELTKTLSEEYFYRTRQFPTSGVFKVNGPKNSKNYLLIAFTPGGAFRNVNQNLIAPLIKKTPGPARMIQFAFSSDVTGLALLEKAKKDFRTARKFDFIGIGEAAFSMQTWSEYLEMSGLTVSKNNRELTYEDDPKNPWLKTLTPEQMKNLRSSIFVAPENYKTITQKINGENRSFGAVVHHKLFSVGPYASMGTSFNLSDSAETNHEQILIFHEPILAEAVEGIAQYLSLKSRTLFEEAERRMNNSR